MENPLWRPLMGKSRKKKKKMLLDNENKLLKGGIGYECGGNEGWDIHVIW